MNELQTAVKAWCDDVTNRDAWMWRSTCQRLMADIDYTAPSKITPEHIRCTLESGQAVELLRLHDGWGIRWGKPKG